MSLARPTRKHRGLALVLLASALLTTACGLKADVKDQLAQGGGAAAPGGGTTGLVDAGTTGGTTGGAAGTTGGFTTGGTGGTSGASGTSGTTGSLGGTGTTGGSTGSAGGTSTTGGAPNAPVQGQGTTTGIDFKNKTIKVILHGPLTGAGVPQESFRTGGPKYWDQSGPKGGPRLILGGFRVIAEAVDDKYNAQDALRACNAAAKTAFLIIGGAGTDQIQACGQSQVLRRGNVPYLSSGVTETGLGSVPNYFATSLSYKQQSPLVIRAARENGYLNKKWAVVITGTPNFADARESIVAELKKAGVQGKAGPFNPDQDVYLTEKAPNNCVDVGTKLRAGAYESVYFLGQPLFFGQCVNQWPSATYTGPGPSFGIQSVADLACRGGAAQYHAYYLHPAPDVAMAQQIAKKWAPDTPAFKDDIESGIWGGMQGLEQAFNLVKGPLSRESFIAALAAAGVPGGVTNPAVYNGGSRFGGTGAYLNKITCSGSSGVIKTIANYKQ
ncbi:MAG: branched-chain amino acid transport system substrate-binding protein [Actinomycetota bacterium]|jgi:hypothetical protein|nr:branched-chain amino acid transport system substrate-binding protein [Actinomycetota bacterium]